MRMTSRLTGALPAAVLLISAASAVSGCTQEKANAAKVAAAQETKTVTAKDTEQTREQTAQAVQKSDAEWRRTLTPEQYQVLRQAGTERPFTGAYWNHREDGTYTCAGCGTALFTSKEKYDTDCGWPSFYDALDKSKIVEREDRSHGMRRVEVLCRACGGHLGHVFNDGPNPTGLRYCINSVSLGFQKETPKEQAAVAEKPKG